MKKESLSQLCNMAIESVKHRVRPEVDMHVMPNLCDVTVYTDSRRLMQILVQLLSNSAKFTKHGSIEVGFHADEEAGKAYISVTDTGIGVSLGDAERVFERFVKLDRSSQGIGISTKFTNWMEALRSRQLSTDLPVLDVQPPVAIVRYALSILFDTASSVATSLRLSELFSPVTPG